MARQDLPVAEQVVGAQGLVLQARMLVVVVQHPADGNRAGEVFRKCFDAGVFVRYTGDVLAFSPPLIIEKTQIDQIVDAVRNALRAVA